MGERNLSVLSLDNWDVSAHPMKKTNDGVFEIKLEPTADGKPRIPHDSKVKV